jgi:hypothetical protein
MSPCPSAIPITRNEANSGICWRDGLRAVHNWRDGLRAVHNWRDGLRAVLSWSHGRTGRSLSLHPISAVLPVLLALLAAAGCSMPQQRFSHSRHRENFAITTEELNGIQFYLSGEVLVKARPAADAAVGDDPTGEETEPVEQAILFPAGTPGVVTEVGPDWLRVSFQEGRPGAYFLANAREKHDDLYYLATRDEKDELRRVEDLEPRAINYEMKTYIVVYGASAHLLVDGEALQELIESRTRSEGRKIE